MRILDCVFMLCKILRRLHQKLKEWMKQNKKKKVYSILCLFFFFNRMVDKPHLNGSPVQFVGQLKLHYSHCQWHGQIIFFSNHGIDFWHCYLMLTPLFTYIFRHLLEIRTKSTFDSSRKPIDWLRPTNKCSVKTNISPKKKREEECKHVIQLPTSLGINVKTLSKLVRMVCYAYSGLIFCQFLGQTADE